MASPASDFSVDELTRFLSASHGANDGIARAQIVQRQTLIASWGIARGARVLELGCGQGDCTVALAGAVGPHGHITAVDPGPATYGAPSAAVAISQLTLKPGSPLTLGQAQAAISATALGPRITWHTGMDPLVLLAADPSATWDVAVLAQCIWYFPDPATVLATLSALRGRVARICVSEYALSGSTVHVLAALTQATLASRTPTPGGNIRTCLSPAAIKALALRAGVVLQQEAWMTPPEEYPDGRWEVGDVVSPRFLTQIEDVLPDERDRVPVVAMRDAVIAAKLRLEGQRARSMDIWVACFTA